MEDVVAGLDVCSGGLGRRASRWFFCSSIICVELSAGGSGGVPPECLFLLLRIPPDGVCFFNMVQKRVERRSRGGRGTQSHGRGAGCPRPNPLLLFAARRRRAARAPQR